MEGNRYIWHFPIGKILKMKKSKVLKEFTMKWDKKHSCHVWVFGYINNGWWQFLPIYDSWYDRLFDGKGRYASECGLFVGGEALNSGTAAGGAHHPCRRPHRSDFVRAVLPICLYNFVLLFIIWNQQFYFYNW